ncbi:MAG: nicotinate phosphoribosyltransferase [Candidatus Omnitrophica bacterium]|nr:nicotinate phosphoribosyltransferase [Candidatus Omnitrophota bacterium]
MKPFSLLIPDTAFKHPAGRIRTGFYSDVYFSRTQKILEREGRRARVVMQIFCKEHALLCGVQEVLALLKQQKPTGAPLKVRALKDGTGIRPWETVLTLEGEYRDFCTLETLILGILTRRTSIATQMRRLVQAASPKGVIYFGARFDHYLMQEGDGYAVRVGGALASSTPATEYWFGREGTGTIPHGLIAAFQGDTTAAALAFDRHIVSKIKRIVLVDFDNDCVGTALATARVLGRKLWGVRLDTAENLTDRAITRARSRHRGVSPLLIRLVRRALDRAGFARVKIIVSGGFNETRIRDFVRRKVPFDLVGVGSNVHRFRVDFTADVVSVNGRPCAKVGRRFRPNPRLKRVDV